jgi:hypothetical protein
LLHQFCAMFALFIVITACSRAPASRQITVDIKNPAIPIAIVNAADGGFFLMLQSTTATLVKLDSDGRIEWKFEEAAPNDISNVSVKLSMVSALDDGGAILCGMRNVRYPSSVVLPGFVVRLDSRGHEIRRIDPLRSGFDGDAFYDTMTCASWGSGFVISAMETADASAGPFNPYTNGQVFVLKLSSDLSVIWKRPLAVGGSGVPTRMTPRALKTGDLIFPGSNQIFLIDPDGNVKTAADLPGMCRWVRSAKVSAEIQFSCDGGPFPNVIKFDSNLKMTKAIIMSSRIESLPIITQLQNGDYVTLSNRANPAGPTIKHFDSSGKYIDEQDFSDGLLTDVISLNKMSGVLVLRTVNRDDYLHPNISFIEY